ncbi:hypothetical protein SNE40_002751 [Patella caerulea]|uniref:LITAF domain-containing protein n=1 Tax=Patella caerulea TaxID=87958 RepID=A0AAN8QEI6_PATCE
MAEKNEQPPPYEYQPPPEGVVQYPPNYTQPTPGQLVTQNVIVQEVPVVGITPRPGSVGRYQQSPELIICQHCNATVTTSVSYETGMLTWAASGILCLVGCWFGCCLIPFCVNASKDVIHTCPNCKQLNGKFRHFS